MGGVGVVVARGAGGRGGGMKQPEPDGRGIDGVDDGRVFRYAGQRLGRVAPGWRLGAGGGEVAQGLERLHDGALGPLACRAFYFFGRGALGQVGIDQAAKALAQAGVGAQGAAGSGHVVGQPARRRGFMTGGKSGQPQVKGAVEFAAVEHGNGWRQGQGFAVQRGDGGALAIARDFLNPAAPPADFLCRSGRHAHGSVAPGCAKQQFNGTGHVLQRHGRFHEGRVRHAHDEAVPAFAHPLFHDACSVVAAF